MTYQVIDVTAIQEVKKGRRRERPRAYRNSGRPQHTPLLPFLSSTPLPPQLFVIVNNEHGGVRKHSTHWGTGRL